MRTNPLTVIPPKTNQEQPATTSAEMSLRPIVRDRRKRGTAATSATTPPATGGRRVSVTLEDDNVVVIRIPLSAENPAVSSSGKSLLLGTTRGPRRVEQRVGNTVQDIVFRGQPVRAVASVFVAHVDNSSSKKAT